VPSEADLAGHSGEPIDPHAAEPVRALKLAKALGHLPETVTVVGCEPATCQPGMSLSVTVHAAVDRAAQTIRQMVLLGAGGRGMNNHEHGTRQPIQRGVH
jgi:hydrogenase maturation protease